MISQRYRANANEIMEMFLARTDLQRSFLVNIPFQLLMHLSIERRYPSNQDKTQLFHRHP